MACSEQILEQKRRALLAKEALEQEHVQRAEQERREREVLRTQAKARRIAEAQRAQQRAALDLQQKTTYFQVLISTSQSCLLFCSTSRYSSDPCCQACCCAAKTCFVLVPLSPNTLDCVHKTAWLCVQLSAGHVPV